MLFTVTISIAIIGKINSGKTSILNRLYGHGFSKRVQSTTKTTIYSSKEKYNNVKIDLVSYDICAYAKKDNDGNSDDILKKNDIDFVIFCINDLNDKFYIESYIKRLKKCNVNTNKVIGCISKYDIAGHSYDDIKWMEDIFEAVFVTSAKDNRGIEEMKGYIIMNAIARERGIKYGKTTNVNHIYNILLDKIVKYYRFVTLNIATDTTIDALRTIVNEFLDENDMFYIEKSKMLRILDMCKDHVNPFSAVTTEILPSVTEDTVVIKESNFVVKRKVK